MPSKSIKGQSPKRLESNRGPSFISVLRPFVSAWRRYMDLQSWALVVYAIIIVATGNLFTIAGLALLAAVAITILLYCLEKWLNKYE